MDTNTHFFSEKMLILKEKSERERERIFSDVYAYTARTFGSINQILQYLRYSMNKETTKPSLL